jgi:hypothetical protein
MIGTDITAALITVAASILVATLFIVRRLDDWDESDE